MKKTIITLFTVMAMNAFSQINPSNSNTGTKIANPLTQQNLTCTGNSMRSQDAIEKSAMFNAVGINIMKYDWSDQQINCHINETVSKFKSSRMQKTLAWTCVSFGAAMMIVGLVTEGTRQPGYQSSYGWVESSGPSGAPYLIIGALSIGGSIPLFIGGGSAKKKSNMHLQEVSEYYRKKGWY